MPEAALARGVGEPGSRIGDCDEVRAGVIANGLRPLPEMREVRQCFHRRARLARHDVSSRRRIRCSRHSRDREWVGRVEHVERWLTFGASERAAQHFGAQARAAHSEHDAVAPSRLTNLNCQRLQRRKLLVHSADDIEPAKAVVDHQCCGCVTRLPDIRVPMPDARGDVRRRGGIERYCGCASVEVLALRVSRTHGVDLFRDPADQLVVRVRELLHAVIEQLLRDGLHVDAGLGELVHHPVCARVVGLDRVAGNDAVIEESLDGCGRHCVHGVRTDQRFRVDHVAIVGILGAGACPEGTLHMAAGGAQGRETLAAEALFEQLVREDRIGDRRFAQQALDERVSRIGRELLLEQLVHERVNAAHEERCNRVHVERLSVLVPHLERGDVLLDHAFVHREGKDQGHVHVAPVGDGPVDRGHALERCRDLDHEVGAVDPLPERPRSRDGARPCCARATAAPRGSRSRQRRPCAHAPGGGCPRRPGYR